MVTNARQAGRAATGLALYTRCAEASTARIIGQYSTSFGLATRLLRADVRAGVRNIYGLVRIADEIVDGAAAQAGVDPIRQRGILDALERETMTALADGYSANLVVHAFAATAHAAGITEPLIAPFFASMRRDLDPAPMGADEIGDYIYGSAEVVGLMCLKVFLCRETVTDTRRADLEAGARHLGAAFQKINFLRDLATDWTVLGRNYFPGVNPDALTNSEKDRLLDDIDVDLTAAAAVIPDLPASARSAVAAARHLFAALSVRLRHAPARALLTTRVSVPTTQKLQIFAGALRGRMTDARR